MANFVQYADGKYINMDTVDYVEDYGDKLELYKFAKDPGNSWSRQPLVALSGKQADAIRDWLKRQGRPVFVRGDQAEINIDPDSRITLDEQ